MPSRLNSKCFIEAINTRAVSFKRHSSGIIVWKEIVTERLGRITKKLLTISGVHLPKSDINLLFLKRVYIGVDPTIESKRHVDG